MKTAIVIVLAGISIILVMRQPEATKPLEAATPPEVVQPAAPVRKVSYSPPAVKPADLVLVRGSVKTFTGDGLIVDCAPPIGSHVRPWDGPGWTTSPGAGAAEIEQMAEVAMMADKQNYGEVMELKDGALKVARVRPRKNIEGRVFLVGHPSAEKIADGVEMQVIASPLDGEIYEYDDRRGKHRLQVYTMNYVLTEKDNRMPDWMRK